MWTRNWCNLWALLPCLITKRKRVGSTCNNYTWQLWKNHQRNKMYNTKICILNDCTSKLYGGIFLPPSYNVCLWNVCERVVYNNVIFKRHTTFKLFDEQCPRVYYHMLRSPTQGLIMLALAELTWSWGRPDSIIRKVSSIPTATVYPTFPIWFATIALDTAPVWQLQEKMSTMYIVITYLRKSWLHD